MSNAMSQGTLLMVNNSIQQPGTMGFLRNSTETRTNYNKEYSVASKNEKTLEHFYYNATPRNKELAFIKNPNSVEFKRRY